MTDAPRVPGTWAQVGRAIGQSLLAKPLGYGFMDLRVEGAENLRDVEWPAVFMAALTTPTF